MNPNEALLIVQFVQEACPSQKFSEFTPDVWTELLADLDFTDSRTAAVELTKRQPFIGPHDIRGEVRRIRNGRIAGDLGEPDYDGDDVLGGLQAIRARRKQLGDGNVIPIRPLAPKRDVAKLLDDTLRALPAMPSVAEPLNSGVADRG